ncbi:hypothetical protein C3B55_00548 [Candidatus Pseudomonas adelgestsugas]|uniref:Uncharacterized protein n=1 Tax=Candidatus Pseudomonas adelgestsugas TaxID=1302376 RepID=A0ABX5R8A7_9PSED|nr:hypothetical protein C3B55_00548 [Candidatus Pseudomonas adelgestsugas]
MSSAISLKQYSQLVLYNIMSHFSVSIFGTWRYITFKVYPLVYSITNYTFAYNLNCIDKLIGMAALPSIVLLPKLGIGDFKSFFWIARLAMSKHGLSSRLTMYSFKDYEDLVYARMMLLACAATAVDVYA